MRFLFVPYYSFFQDTRFAPSKRSRLLARFTPLGILQLMASLARVFSPSDDQKLIDVNGSCAETVPALLADTIGELSRHIAGDGSGVVVGFQTIANSLDLSVHLAGQIKSAYPRAVVVLGGPGTAATAAPIMERFAWIDAVLTGEADHSIAQLYELVTGRRAAVEVTGLLWRTDTGAVVSGPPAHHVDNLDELPLPLYAAFPDLAEVAAVGIEAGRGCPYNCSYCSSTQFFQRRYRTKSPERIVAEVRALRSLIPVRVVHFVHDNLLANRHWMEGFCRYVGGLDAGDRFLWTCDGRLDNIPGELATQMRAAGCIRLYCGIESGSARMHRLIGKRLDLPRAFMALAKVLDTGMELVTSFMYGFSDETPEDLELTLERMREAAVAGAEVQFHALAPIPGTAETRALGPRLVFDEEMRSNLVQRPGFGQMTELIAADPEVFSAHYRYPPAYFTRDDCRALEQLLVPFLLSTPWTALLLRPYFGGSYLALLEPLRRVCAASPASGGRLPAWKLLAWIDELAPLIADTLLYEVRHGRGGARGRVGVPDLRAAIRIRTPRGDRERWLRFDVPALIADLRRGIAVTDEARYLMYGRGDS
ncbi:MAG: B12-binding domain-containing radical SAM protein [Candidatus Schekmanbacteria bacterium]|nr:B12-binding domain-containing radical SAM protein [Candidatus Schekmanbacteria bacterium]